MIILANFAMYLYSQSMAQVAGIKVERTSNGVPTFVTIDLRKHADIIPFLEQKGFEVEPLIKWTAKMKRSLIQAKKGEVYARSLKDLLNV
jgi:hypothetical protein